MTASVCWVAPPSSDTGDARAPDDCIIASSVALLGVELSTSLDDTLDEGVLKGTSSVFGNIVRILVVALGVVVVGTVVGNGVGGVDCTVGVDGCRGQTFGGNDGR